MSGTAILMVTWFLAGAEVSSQQVQFNSLAACQAARGAVLADAERLADGVRNASAVCAGKGAAGKAGAVDAAEMDRCVADFIETYLAIGRGEQVPEKNDIYRRIIRDQQEYKMEGIPVEFLARDTCAPGNRYGWPWKDSFIPPPPNPRDPGQWDQWREACLAVKSGHECYREEGRLRLPKPN